MTSVRNLFLTWTALTGSSMAVAHPGHGVSDPAGLLHYLLEPMHLVITALLLVALGVALIGYRRARQRSRQRRD